MREYSLRIEEAAEALCRRSEIRKSLYAKKFEDGKLSPYTWRIKMKDFDTFGVMIDMSRNAVMSVGHRRR